MKMCDPFTEGEGLNWDLFGGDPDPHILQKYVQDFYVSIRPTNVSFVPICNTFVLKTSHSSHFRNTKAA